MRKRIIPDVVHDQDVLFLAAEATVAEACRAMKQRYVGCILVMEGQRPCGLFTERDVVNRVVAVDLNPTKTPLAIVMTRNSDTIAADESPIEALRMMQDRGDRHLPVVAGDCVVGIVSRRDFSATRRCGSTRKRVPGSAFELRHARSRPQERTLFAAARPRPLCDCWRLSFSRLGLSQMGQNRTVIASRPNI